MRAPRASPQQPLPWATGARLKHQPTCRAAEPRRGVDYDPERLGPHLQYLDVDYLASTGALINTTTTSLTKRKTTKNFGNPPARLPR